MLGPKVQVRTEKDDFDQGTWMSLLDLLHPMEFIMPFDQTTLWRRHVAWAKPKGKELRDYIVQRFSSNMVFLSLLLGTDMSVLMNSSHITTEIRQAMMTEQYHSLKFYIGAIMALAGCVTVVALVATYTAWSMISAISDTNANTMLRSSMGQYVTALPSRFVVASLYLFLIWLTLLLIEMVSGPLIFVLLSVTFFLFFQAVISLSAFGRLVAQTGAMSNKRILDPEFERMLLPSGLHASLLIKATERSRRRTSVTEQYRSSTSNETPHSRRVDGSVQDYSSTNASTTAYGSPLREGDLRQLPIGKPDLDREISGMTTASSVGPTPSYSSHRNGADAEDMRSVENAARVFGDFTQSDPVGEPPDNPEYYRSRRARLDSADTDVSVDDLVNQIHFPRASFLNRTGNNQLKNVVNDTLSSRGRDSLPCLVDDVRDEMMREDAMNEVELGLTEDDTPTRDIRNQALRRSLVISNNSIRLQEEWDEEEDVRNVYEIEPPLEISSDMKGGYEVNGFDAIGRPPYRQSRVSFRHLITSFPGSRRTSGSRTLNRIQEKPSSDNAGFLDESYGSGTQVDANHDSEQHRVASKDPYDGYSGERQRLLS